MQQDNEFSKQKLLAKLDEIVGVWHSGTREGNDGNAGHTFEDLMGITENNLSIPDFGIFEIKTRRVEAGSLITLFHKEPKPAATIPKLIVAMGWPHKNPNNKYPAGEMSFRSTTASDRYSVRGFRVVLSEGRISLEFNKNKVASDTIDQTGQYKTYGDWLSDIEQRNPHYQSLFPIFWDESNFIAKCVEKLDNTLFVQCKSKNVGGRMMYMYTEAVLLKGFKPKRLIELFTSGGLFIDFDARTGHNHGTKLRVKLSKVAELFETHEIVG
ncbi:hypothetical protein GCM10008927_27270 [Amylibacter ulvae]|uniref:MvaI/BcnI restriction endonuclease domain-containing protein n=1 Tax=Paramylibacter ulvae TaxID=1651968 RepID=A0ABQ3D5S9_9RHOB|nr:MvaI/BcnI family restriction endonuclease [Amylibacter ulvae]GHA60287.1 hypothetical protein GCM10008927_27270 [Amylibacter ulvae]